MLKMILHWKLLKNFLAPKMSPNAHLRSNNSFKGSRVDSVWHDNESVSCLGPKIWDLVPNEVKESELNLSMFSNSKSKGGSLKDVHVEYAKYILGK